MFYVKPGGVEVAGRVGGDCHIWGYNFVEKSIVTPEESGYLDFCSYAL